MYLDRPVPPGNGRPARLPLTEFDQTIRLFAEHGRGAGGRLPEGGGSQRRLDRPARPWPPIAASLTRWATSTTSTIRGLRSHRLRSARPGRAARTTGPRAISMRRCNSPVNSRLCLAEDAVAGTIGRGPPGLGTEPARAGGTASRRAGRGAVGARDAPSSRRAGGRSGANWPQLQLADRQYPESVWQSAGAYLQGQDYRSAVRMLQQDTSKRELRQHRPRGAGGAGRGPAGPGPMGQGPGRLRAVHRGPSARRGRLPCPPAGRQGLDREGRLRSRPKPCCDENL